MNDTISKRYAFDILSSALSGRYVIDSKYPDLPQTKFLEVEPFDLLEFQLQHQAKLQEIRSNPIVLKLGLYECSLDTEGIHYFKWSKKQREFVGCTVREPLLTSDISGGKGNRLVWVYRNEIVYRDKDGNEFTELDYWDREEMTREEWLKGESIC